MYVLFLICGVHLPCRLSLLPPRHTAHYLKIDGQTRVDMSEAEMVRVLWSNVPPPAIKFTMEWAMCYLCGIHRVTGQMLYGRSCCLACVRGQVFLGSGTEMSNQAACNEALICLTMFVYILHSHWHFLLVSFFHFSLLFSCYPTLLHISSSYLFVLVWHHSSPSVYAGYPLAIICSHVTAAVPKSIPNFVLI